MSTRTRGRGKLGTSQVSQYSQLEREASASQETPREVDSDHPVRWYYDPANDAQVQHVTMKYLYEPHTLVGLILLLGMPIARMSSSLGSPHWEIISHTVCFRWPVGLFLFL
jgi:hypothetical protein